MGMLHGALREDARNAAPAGIRMHRHIRNEIDALGPVTKRDQAGVANDPILLLPHVARERQGCGIGHVIRPAQKLIVAARTAHIREIALTVIVHRV